MLNAILGTKEQMAQTFLKDGRRIPVTIVKAGPCLVTKVKTVSQDGYLAIQVGLGERKRAPSNAVLGQLQKKGIKSIPRFLRELRIREEDKVNVGDLITVDKLFKPGDLANVTGQSLGKGFTGVVKRWGFKGGPRTHGQSDRERAPGSIGQTTTPGRVFKGKKMAGRMGGERVTVKNLQIVSVDPETNEIEILGAVPGIKKGLLIVKRLSAGKLEGIQEVQAQVVEGEAPAGEGAEGEAKTEETAPAAEAPKAEEVTKNA